MIILLPSLISFSRCCMGLLLLFNMKIEKSILILLIFSSAITDFLDGFVSRKFSLETKFGRLFDPIADRFFFFCLFYYMCTFSYISVYEVALFSCRDIASTIHIIIWKFCENIKPPKFTSLIAGKILTLLQYAICIFSIIEINVIAGYFIYILFSLFFVRELFIEN